MKGRLLSNLYGVKLAGNFIYFAIYIDSALNEALLNICLVKSWQELGKVESFPISGSISWLITGSLGQ